MERVLVSVIVILVTTGLAGAQQTAVPDRLTLSEALRIATERNPGFLAARNTVEIAQADRLGASRRLNPALTVQSEGYPLFAPNRPAFLNNQDFSLRIDQEIELSGRRALRTETAETVITVAESQLRDRRRQLELDVRRAYFQAVLAKADNEVAKTALGEIDQVIALNRSRLQQGEISGAELRRLQVERLRFIDDVFAADLALRNATSALLALLNAPDLGRLVDVVEPLEPPAGTLSVGGIVIAASQDVPLNIEALKTQALANRPDLTAARQEEQRADTETRLQRALRSPNVTVGGGYKREFGTNTVVVGATVPLPLANRNQGGVARAEAERRRAANEAAVTEAVVRLDVQQAVNALEINRERVDYIRREYLKNAQESRDIVLASYRLGAADLIDFLDAQRAFRDTQRTYNRAVFDERLSVFLLEAAVGAPAGQR